MLCLEKAFPEGPKVDPEIPDLENFVLFRVILKRFLTISVMLERLLFDLE